MHSPFPRMAAKKKNVIDRLNEDSPEPGAMSKESRRSALAAAHYNPTRLPADAIEYDLKTDSWAQLAMPAIGRRMRALRERLQEPVDVDTCVRSIFPFAHFVFTESGRTAEQALYRGWAGKGIVCQNLLFPTNIAHQIGNDFRPKELPARAFFEFAADVPGKAEIDLAGLRAALEKSPSQVTMVCIELSDNAAGGQPVSVEHLHAVRALLAPHAIPLVLDATRILENARLNAACASDASQPRLFEAVHALLACADTIVASLPKDFCVDKGGLIATNDGVLFRAAHDAADKAGSTLDPLDRRLVALAMRDHRFLEASLDARMQATRRVWSALHARDVPVLAPAGGHCVLIDVGRLPAFSRLDAPVASFLAWLYLETGIRAAAHNAGMRRRPETSALVRIALPMGLDAAQVDTLVARLDASFARSTNIPELVMSNQPSAAFGEMNTEYALKAMSGADAEPVARAMEGDAGQDPPQAPVDSPDETPTVGADAGSEIDEAPGVGDGIEAPGPAERRIFDIAVVGMAGRYPKARNVDELWRNLQAGRDCIEDLPLARYEQRLRYGPAARYRGGFIDDVDKFDSLFFNIPPKDAERLDPQERLFVEVAWETLEDAGYYPESIGSGDAAHRVGVYVGAVWAMYQTLGVEEKHCGESQAPNSFLWSIANRVSYAMNLSGPSLTVDTACSSSLTALYLACEALYAGECGSAIVGGVNLDLHQSKWDINYSGGALSKDGVCRSFGHGANGYVAGEGVGAVYIKPLARAVEDGDRIYGVIKSVVVNHGGRTSGFVVPNPKAQTSLIREALQRARVPAASIGYVEAHGTGTELGDPLEVSALDNAFKDSGIDKRGCALGSLKSNIGHLEAAAGVASLTKILLQMRHGQLVPSLHSAELNEHIDFGKSFFQVQQRLEPWIPREIDGLPQPLRAGISSFGAGGSNAHVIVESWTPPPQAQAPSATVHLLPISARTEAQLTDVARRLRDFLAAVAPLPPLSDIAFTLQSGRKPFDHRAVVLARSVQEARERLAAFLAGKRNDGVFSGNVKNADPLTRLMSRSEREEVVGLLSRRRDPAKFAKLWVDGMFSEWRGTQGATTGRRVSLPTYPFADKRHWVPISTANASAALPLRAGLHPLLDSNESTFERQIFRKSFNEREFFIYDHLVMDVPTLPGVAYLELARKAGELAADRPVRKLHNIVWVSPIAVKQGQPSEAWIELKPATDGVRFEVYGEIDGQKTLHSQGRISYGAGEPDDEHLDLAAIQARCEKAIEGRDAYPLFKSFGLNLGPSFQSLQEVYRGDGETLGRLKLPESRLGDLASMLLHPSLVDGSLQAGVAAQLGDSSGNMLVPFSIGEVEVLHPLPAECWSHVTEMKNERAENSRVSRKNVTILDATGKVLVRIKEATGVPIAEVHKPASGGETSSFAKLYYAPEWRPSALDAPAREGDDGKDRILFFDDDAALSEACRRTLSAGGRDHRVVLATPASAYADVAPDRIEFDPADQAGYERVIASTIVDGGVDRICIAWPLHDNPVEGASRDLRIERGAHAALAVCKALTNAKLDRRVQLLFAYPIRDAMAPVEYEAIAGLFRAMHLEFPKVRCRVVGIERSEADTDRIAALLRAEFGDDAADAVSVRHLAGVREVRSLKAHPLQPHAEAASVEHLPREGGVYLITGGAGGLGLIFAEYLATHYRARLVLTGRSVQNEAIAAACERVRACGGEALYVPADVCDLDSLRHAVDEAHRHFGEINGIIHSAGVLRDSFIRNKTREDFDAVLAPKLQGTLNLDAATLEEPLDFFVLFSSMAAVAGNAGQADYGYANHYMDSFAFARERMRAGGTRRGKTLSLNWSLWADGGMRVDEQTEQMFTRTLGLKLLATDTGTAAMIDALASDATQLAVLEGIQDKIEIAWGLRKKPVAASAPASSEAAAAGVAASPATGHAASVQAELTRIAMDFLKLDEADISPDSVLLDLGFDSIGLTTYANEINSVYGVDVTPVLFFDYPSIQEVAKYLAAERSEEVARVHAGSAAASSAAAPSAGAGVVAPVPRAEEPGIRFGKGWDPAAIEAPRAQSPAEFRPANRFVDMPIAIIGMSGKMPESDDLDEFWAHLRNGDDLISVIPRDRWNWEEFYGDPFKEANKSNSKWGGFMKEVDKFDALFFGISKREAQMMDPQQRIFLETVWKAIEDSGHRVSDFSGTRTGLFVGAATNDYVDLMNRLDIDLDGYSASGNSHSVLANRISFLLNLRGPSAPIDTACSSSLVALHRAIESIHTGSCEMAIVGGVQVMLSPAAYISFGMAGMLSNDGKCKSFDKRADGYVRGEGSGAIVLKPLHQAEADGDHIHAVIRATAENHGGKVTTLTAPNSAAQAELLIEAYEKAHVDPARVGYIECHGTGTSLGDPIEIQALTKAFGELYKRHDKAPGGAPHCGLSSAKTNIGHLETAAGIAGILRVLLAIKHRQIPANVHFEEINPYIKLSGTPFYIVDKTREWAAPRASDGREAPRLAGVSSFGFGGANAHVVLEEYIEAPRSPSAAGSDAPQLIVLSAKAADRLEAYAASMLAALEAPELDFADFAYTLQVGRDEMSERLAFVAGDATEAKEKFARYLRGDVGNDLFVGSVRGSKKAADSVVPPATARHDDLQALASRWTQGAQIDWTRLQRSRPPRRLSLPTYPFARERCWIPGADGLRTKAAALKSPAPSTASSKAADPSVAAPATAKSPNRDVVPETVFFLPTWTKPSATKPPAVRTRGAVVLFVRDAAQASHLSDRFVQAGLASPTIVTVLPGEDFCRQSSVSYVLREDQKRDYESLFDGLSESGLDVSDVVFGWSEPSDVFEAGSQARAIHGGVTALLSLVQALASWRGKQGVDGQSHGTIRLLNLYTESQDRQQPQDAAIGAFFRSLALEVRGIRFCNVGMTGEGASSRSDEALCDGIFSLLAEVEPGQVEGMLVDGEYFERRFEVHAVPEPEATIVRERGVYVITGGAGGLGLIFARYLASRTNAGLVLLGRSELDGDRAAALDALRSSGSRVLYVRCDVADREDVSRAFARARTEFGRIDGVIHAAGSIHDSPFSEKTPSAFEDTFATKVLGTLNIDAATADDDLDFFVTFSSIASVLGSAGQCDYAYANGFLDRFSELRRRLADHGLRRGKTLSIGWPLWRDGGMRPEKIKGIQVDAQARAYWQSHTGMHELETESGLRAFEECLQFDAPVVTVLHGDRAKLMAMMGVPVPAATSVTQTGRAGQVRGVAPNAADLAEHLENDLLRIVADVLLIEPERLSRDVNLNEYGLDSIGVANLVRIVNERYSLDLAPALLFEYPTYEAFSGHLLDAHRDSLAAHYAEALGAGEDSRNAHHSAIGVEASTVQDSATIDGSPSPSIRQTVSRDSGSADVAIIGISAVMPGADSAATFWRNLVAGVDPITEVPTERWDWRGSGDAAAMPRGIRWGGFLADVDKFDAGFFEIAPSEAALMDPQQRLFLQSAWNAVEDAGHRIADLAGTRTGVFVGLSGFDYSEVIRASGIGSVAQSATGMAHCLLPNRLSYLLDLRGPSEAIDTACSSSLVAVHRAAEAIANGDCEMAIAGGVNLMLAPSLQMALGHAGMLAGNGRCKTFDQRADGYVRSEGCAAVLLKRLDRAVADGDEIYGVVKGSAVNHGGRAMGLTAPNPNAQAEVVAEAYRRAGVDVAQVGLIETHGTGTPMGDAVELNGLKKAFGGIAARTGTDDAQVGSSACMVSSVKTHIGHLEAASGIASLIKVLLSIRHRTIPGLLHFEDLSPQIRLEGSRFRIARDTCEWRAFEGPSGDALPLTAGVSSFGFGGVNAHVVVQEHAHVEHAPVEADDRGLSRLILLSAKTPAQLRQRAAALAQFLDADPAAGDAGLARIACTLQTGRDHMVHRLGIRAGSLEELSKQLHAFLADGHAPAGAYCGEAGRTSESVSSIDRDPQLKRMIVEKWIENGDHGAILELWSRGVDIDWNSLYGGRRPRRTHLPGYPFARSRHWVDTFQTSVVQAAPKDSHASAPVEASPAVASPDAPSSRTSSSAFAGTPKALAIRFLRRALSQQLQVPPESLPLDRTLLEMGVVSSGIASLVREVNTTFDLDLVPSLMFEHPTIDGFATHLSETAADALLRHVETQPAEEGGTVVVAMPPQVADDQEARHVLQDRELIERVLWKQDANDEDYERVTF